MKPCPYCMAGETPLNGEHWIVRSVASARLTVKPCSAPALQNMARSDEPAVALDLGGTPK
jgi:hypothetical protein